MRDPETLARAPQHWFIAQGWRAPGAQPLPLPRQIAPGPPAAFTFDLAAPRAGWQRDARLRIQFAQPPGEGAWRATCNGAPLVTTPDVSEPFPVPYPSMLGRPEELRAWLVPAPQLRDGANRVELAAPDGAAAATVVFLDLSID